MNEERIYVIPVTKEYFSEEVSDYLEKSFFGEMSTKEWFEEETFALFEDTSRATQENYKELLQLISIHGRNLEYLSKTEKDGSLKLKVTEEINQGLRDSKERYERYLKNLEAKTIEGGNKYE